MKDSKRKRSKIVIYNRRSKSLEAERLPGKRLTNFFYGTYIGRGFCSLLLTRSPISTLYGRIQNHWISSRKIADFIEKWDINIDEIDFPPEGYRSFNEFFTRKLKAERRPVHPDPRILISPADSRLLAYPIRDGIVHPLHGIAFSVGELIADQSTAFAYNSGLCLVFRLAPSDYHRFFYVDDGEHGPVNSIGGKLHSVNPIAIRCNLKIFQKNYREYCILKTRNFDEVIQVEVGALLVGKIHQNLWGGGRFFRGQEKGYFEFGASTIVMVFKPSIVTIDEDVVEYSRRGIETFVQYGSAIGIRSLRPT